jgi:uncharacterized protein YcbK (DUF882 family)
MMQPVTSGLAKAALICALIFSAFAFVAGPAAAETRTLKLYFTHTKESATITYKRNGRYDQGGLKKINRFLRDWRRKESTKMDPAVIDLLWEVYQATGSKKPIHIISGYRSPRTNNMLRRRGRGVAKNSQHTKGKAIDFFLPDVPVTKIRSLGLRAHRGGVGYYKGSFVHLDTGSVRHWPRMNRRQLAKVFPRGRTIHVPSDGKPMKGHKVAMANLKKGLNADGSRRGTSVQPTLLARLFNRTGDDGDEGEGNLAAPTPSARPAATAVAEARPIPGLENPGRSIFELEAEEQARQGQLLASIELDRIAVPVARPSRDGEGIADGGATLTALAPVDRADELAVRTAAALGVNQPQNNASVAAATVPTLADAQATTELRVAAIEPNTQVIANRLSLGEEQPDVSGLSARVASTLDADAGRRADMQKMAERAAQLAAATKAALEVTRARETAALAATAQPTTTPSWRANAAPQEQPAATDRGSMMVSAIGTYPAQLTLGDLGSSVVKEWAVSDTTRVGPMAKLRAPIYERSTNHAMPTRVYSVGFGSQRSTLAADGFNTRSAGRGGFAEVAALNF